MAIVVLTFRDDSSFGQYLAQLENAALSGSIQKWMIQKHSHILVGEDLPDPVALGTFVNNHCVTFSSEDKLKVALDGATLPSVYNIKNKGGMFTFAGLDGAIISAEAQAVLDRMTGLTQTETDAIITFVNAESASLGNGNWALIDEFFSFGLAGANALVGFIAKTAVNTLATFSIEGAAFNGTTAYINSNFTPSTDGVNLKLGDGQYGVFIASYLDVAGNTDPCGTFPNNTSFRRSEDSNRWANRYVNNVGTTAIISEDRGLLSDSLYIVSLNGTQIDQYKNGVSQLSSSGSGTEALAAQPFFIGANNNAGGAFNFMTGTISSFIAGASIGFDQAAHNTNLLNYLIDLGTFAQPVIDSFPNALAAGEEALITDFINAEVRAGNWGKYDSFVLMSLTDPVNALWDWVRKVGMTNTAAVHSAGVGYVFNGTTAWIDSNYNPSTQGINYKLDDANIGVFVTSYNYASGVGDHALFGGGGSLYFLNITEGDLTVRINDATNSVVAQAISNNSLYSFDRVSASLSNVKKDGVNIATPNRTSSVVPTVNLSIGVWNSASPSGFIGGTLSSFIAGAAIGFDQAAYFSNLSTLNAALAP